MLRIYQMEEGLFYLPVAIGLKEDFAKVGTVL